jgi:tetratricopeptide (TPR) repeat protein
MQETFRRAFALTSRLRPNVQVRNKSKLAGLYVAQGRYQEAGELFLKTIDLGRRALPGKRHPDTFHAMNGPAILRTKQGDYDKAAHLFQEVLEGRKEKLGGKHPETLETIDNIGVLHRERYRFDETEPLLIQTFEARRLKLSDTHPHTLRSWRNLIQKESASGD